MSAFRDIWYHSEDKLRLYARDYACRDATMEHPPVVLCMHGLSRNSADFAQLAEHLSQHCRIIAVDVRGRGRSDYDSNIANYTPLTYVSDMFELLGQLQIEEVILCGTSMGGLMSFLMGAMQPQRVRGMIINDIGPEVDQRGLQRIKGYVGKSAPVSTWEEAVVQARSIAGPAFADFSDEEWLDFTRGSYRDEDGVPVLAYDPAIAQPMADESSGAVPPDLWPLFESLTAIPMLLIRGASSDILAPNCVEKMLAIKADLQFAEIAGRGHAPTLNENSSRAAIDAFLDKL